ncbi:MAG: PIN domain-containing protein [Desulfobacterales bacterium]|nr:PIN domain-containing protein [Desulfobacterales bacterium]
MPLLRAIIDTNVVFEGLTQQGGTPGLIIDAWAAGLFRACVSNALSYEYEDVLSRKLSDKRWRRIKPALGALLDKSEFVTVYYTWRPASPDPGDDHLIDCALNSGTMIVTSNIRDFREAEKSLGLTIMTPDGFVALMAH